MIIVSFSIPGYFGYDKDLENKIEEIMIEAGFEDIGAGSGFGDRDVLYGAVLEDEDNLAAVRAGEEIEKVWVADEANVNRLRNLAADRNIEIRFEEADEEDFD